MFSKLLIALQLKKQARPVTVAHVHVPPKPRTSYGRLPTMQRPAGASSSAPVQDTGIDLMNAALLHSTIANHSPAPTNSQEVNTSPVPFSSGRSGDYAGGGATSSWERSDASPSYDSSSSSDSSSSDSSSSDNG